MSPSPIKLENTELASPYPIEKSRIQKLGFLIESIELFLSHEIRLKKNDEFLIMIIIMGIIFTMSEWYFRRVFTEESLNHLESSIPGESWTFFERLPVSVLSTVATSNKSIEGFAGFFIIFAIFYYLASWEFVDEDLTANRKIILDKLSPGKVHEALTSADPVNFDNLEQYAKDVYHSLRLRAIENTLDQSRTREYAASTFFIGHMFGPVGIAATHVGIAGMEIYEGFHKNNMLKRRMI